MKKLVSRSHGESICNISDDDFLAIGKKLVLHSESSPGYYLNPETMKVLNGLEISSAVLRALQRHMGSAGLDLGWEEEPAAPGSVFQGRTIDSGGDAIGGVRVMLISAGHNVLNWAYTRPDGCFRVVSPQGVEPRHIRFAGRGDLILREFAVEDGGDYWETEIDTLTGKVIHPDGKPVFGVSVQLLDWMVGSQSDYQELESRVGGLTWGDTNESGDFAIPIRIDDARKGWQAALEILAPKGQTLRKFMITIHPGEGLDLGHLECPVPAEDWGGEALQPKRSVVMYPGVSERPLS